MPMIDQIEMWPIVLLNELFSFVPWLMPFRTVCRGWSHICDNCYGMVIQKVRSIHFPAQQSGLLKYIDFLMKGRANVKEKSLRVLRLKIDTYRSLSYYRLMGFLQWLSPIKHSQMFSLYLEFSLDFDACDRMAVAVASLIPTHITTVELFFLTKCHFTEHGALAIAHSVSKTIGLRNVVVLFSGMKVDIINKKDIAFPGDEAVQKCGKVMLLALPPKQRVWRTSKLFATTNYRNAYSQITDGLTGNNFDGVNLFQ
jgi:hypothetical protein